MRQYHSALDGLRAAAVGIVLAAHADVPYLRSGGVGVDIFFVLSGFLITGILSDEFGRAGRISRRNFYVRRLLRLTPCLVLTTALFTVLHFIEHGRVPFDVIGIVLTYTANFARVLSDVDLSSMAHTWSLAIEEQYYLVWPAVVIALERFSRRASTKFLILLALSLGVAIYRAALAGFYSPGRMYFMLDTHMDGLVLGSSISYLVAAMLQSRSAWARGLKLLSTIAVPVSIAALIAIMRYVMWWEPAMGRYGYFVVAVAAATLVLDLVASPYSLIKRALGLAPMVYIGRVSYGLYLLHFPIFQFINYRFPALPLIERILFQVTLTLAAAILSYHLVETKVLRLKRYFHSGEHEPLQVSAAVPVSAEHSSSTVR